MIVASELNYRLLRKAVIDDPSLAADGVRLANLGRQMLRSPEQYAKDPEDRALIALEKAVTQGRREIDDDLDAAADAYDAQKPYVPSKLPRMRALLAKCLEEDAHCYDARNLQVLVDADGDDQAIEQLELLEVEARAWCEARSAELDEPAEDPWDRVCLRPWLRIRARIIDMLIKTTSYRAALELAETMLEEAPADGQGIRHTAALLYARLEDEEGLDDLDLRYDRSGSCWMHLARATLLYKLGRMDAARRATLGLARLCPGAAYYVLNPDYVEPYLPDRPPFASGSKKESLLATYEGDFIIVDTPDFVGWAGSLEEFARIAEKFGRTI